MAALTPQYSPTPRFMVHKLSLVKFKPWSVIDTHIPKDVERYHTRTSADRFCNWCNEHGKAPASHSDYLDFTSATEAPDKRERQLEDTPPPRHSIKRRIELDG